MDRQRTIRNEIRVSGIGLHTGKKVNVILKPAPADNGIIFRRMDLAAAPAVEASAANILQRATWLQRTSIRKNNAEVHTIEHLMAALSGFGIDNVFVDIDGMEVPGLDGSAKDLADALEKTGFIEQDMPKRFIEIEKPIVCRKERSSIEVFPDSKFIIDYFLEFERPWIKNHSFSIAVHSSDEFARFFRDELAPSRTFCLEEEAAALLKAGLGKGATLDNTLVIGKNGPIRNQLRFPDELARHKVLDLLGDLYLLGGHLKGRVTARRSGHQLNAMLVKKISEESCDGHRRNQKSDAASVSLSSGR